MSTRGTPPSTRAWLLRRADQSAVAALLALALAAMAVYWVVQGGWPLGNAGRRLIEIDRQPAAHGAVPDRHQHGGLARVHATSPRG